MKASYRVRVDDRRLHGQVLLGWGIGWGAQRILLVDASAAANPTQRAFYESLAEGDYEVEVVDADGATRRLDAAVSSGERLLVVVPSLAAAEELRRRCEHVKSIQIGGLRDPQRPWRLHPAVFLDAADLQQLRAWLEEGIRVEIQELPDRPPIRVDSGMLQALVPTQHDEGSPEGG